MTNHPSTMTRRQALSVLAALPLALTTGCSVVASESGPSNLRMLIPNTPGGGYDLTARTAARVLEDRGLTGPIEKFNVVGGGGAVALARMMRESGTETLLAMVGLGVVGAAQVNSSPWGLSDTTALARLVDEPEAIVVRAGAPFGSIEALLANWQRNPSRLIVGAGSAEGGPDHVFALEVARAIGLPVNDIQVVLFNGAGDLLTALLDGSVDVGAAGAGEYIDQIQNGSLRVLAVSNETGIPGMEIPSLVDSGLDVEFTNWRGFVAPPNIPSSSRDELIDALTRMRAADAWQRAVTQHGWADSFLPGDAFSEFLVAEDRRMSQSLAELGIRGQTR